MPHISHEQHVGFRLLFRRKAWHVYVACGTVDQSRGTNEPGTAQPWQDFASGKILLALPCPDFAV